MNNGEKYLRFIHGAIILLGMLIAAGYAAFYLFKLTPGVVAGILMGVPLLIIARHSIRHNRPIRLTKPIGLIGHIRQIRSIFKNQKIPARGWSASGGEIRNLLLSLLHLLLVILCFVILFQSQSSEALRSPWEVVPHEFFVFYFLASLTLVGSILLNPNKGESPFAPTRTIIQISLHTFLTASVAVIVYRIGYGFDPFIHRATEKMLIEAGTIAPKPLFYIGQYTLVAILHHLTQIPLSFIDKWLVPVIGSLLVPPIIFSSLRNIFNSQKYTLFGALLPVLLPFSFLFVTVPQNLANIFLIILIFSNLGREKNFYFLWFLALITLFIHPLSGIPALIYVSVLTLWRKKGAQPLAPTPLNIKKILFVICHLSFVIIIPLFFLIGSLASSELTVTFGNQPLLPFLNLQAFNWLSFHSLLHSVYWYASNSSLIFLILVTVGLFSCFVIPDSSRLRHSSSGCDGWIRDPETKNKKFFLFLSQRLIRLWRDFLDSRLPLGHELVVRPRRVSDPEWEAEWRGNDMKHYLPLLLTFLILILNLFFSKFIVFSSLVNYEQGDFYARIWQIALLFLSPFFVFGIVRLVGAGLAPAPGGRGQAPPLQKMLTLIVVSCLLSVNLYLWYPRVDELAPKARAFAVSQADVEAVRWIEHDAKGADYVVLTNQSVSAAALQELGFKKYYRQLTTDNSQPTTSEQIFFYPIPTGGPLYQLYLKMVYDAPDRKYIDEALRMTGAKRAYFVLNDYWLDAEKIKTSALRAAEAFHTINNGSVIILIYSSG